MNIKKIISISIVAIITCITSYFLMQYTKISYPCHKERIAQIFSKIEQDIARLHKKQPEQNQIITKDQDQTVVIQGCAESGMTCEGDGSGAGNCCGGADLNCVSCNGKVAANGTTGHCQNYKTLVPDYPCPNSVADGLPCSSAGECQSGCCWSGTCESSDMCCPGLDAPCTGGDGNTNGSCCSDLICAACYLPNNGGNDLMAAPAGQGGLCQSTSSWIVIDCGSGGIGAPCYNTAACQTDLICSNNQCSCNPNGLGAIDCPCTTGSECVTGCCAAGLCQDADMCCLASGQPCTGASGNTHGDCCSDLLCGVCGTTAAQPGQAGWCQDAAVPTLTDCNSTPLGLPCQTTQECQYESNYYVCDISDGVSGTCVCSSPAGLNCPCQASNTCASPLICGEDLTCVECLAPSGPCNNVDQCCINQPYCIIAPGLTTGSCSCAVSSCSALSESNGCQCDENTQCCSGSCMNVGGNTLGTCQNPGIGGATCYNAGNCADGFYCNFDLDPTMGICQCAQPGGTDCPCTNEGECAENYYCNSISGSDGSCQPATLSLGTNCVSANECATNSACQHDTGAYSTTADVHTQTITIDNANIQYYSCSNGSCTLTANVQPAVTALQNSYDGKAQPGATTSTHEDKEAYENNKTAIASDQAYHQNQQNSRRSQVADHDGTQYQQGQADEQSLENKGQQDKQALTSNSKYITAKADQSKIQAGKPDISCTCKDDACTCTVGKILHNDCVCSDSSCVCTIPVTVAPVSSNACTCTENGMGVPVCSCAPETGAECYCNSNSDCDSGNCYGGVCENTEGTAMVCSNNGQCSSSICQDGACQCSPNPTQASCPCAQNTDCESGVCTAGLCATCTMDGIACSQNYQCCKSDCVDYMCGGIDAWINYIVMAAVTVLVIVTAGAASVLYTAYLAPVVETVSEVTATLVTSVSEGLTELIGVEASATFGSIGTTISSGFAAVSQAITAATEALSSFILTTINTLTFGLSNWIIDMSTELLEFISDQLEEWTAQQIGIDLGSQIAARSESVLTDLPDMDEILTAGKEAGFTLVPGEVSGDIDNITDAITAAKESIEEDLPGFENIDLKDNIGDIKSTLKESLSTKDPDKISIEEFGARLKSVQDERAQLLTDQNTIDEKISTIKTDKSSEKVTTTIEDSPVVQNAKKAAYDSFKAAKAGDVKATEQAIKEADKVVDDAQQAFDKAELEYQKALEDGTKMQDERDEFDIQLEQAEQDLADAQEYAQAAKANLAKAEKNAQSWILNTKKYLFQDSTKDYVRKAEQDLSTDLNEKPGDIESKLESSIPQEDLEKISDLQADKFSEKTKLEDLELGVTPEDIKKYDEDHQIIQAKTVDTGDLADANKIKKEFDALLDDAKKSISDAKAARTKAETALQQGDYTQAQIFQDQARDYFQKTNELLEELNKSYQKAAELVTGVAQKAAERYEELGGFNDEIMTEIVSEIPTLLPYNIPNLEADLQSLEADIATEKIALQDVPAQISKSTKDLPTDLNENSGKEDLFKDQEHELQEEKEIEQCPLQGLQADKDIKLIASSDLSDLDDHLNIESELKQCA